ncbi:hypothetical protein QLX08_010158 [Tetragonisca angustula]|uniref:Uncharacterized protein n=1 Tax=Tetragonisca angustula TaxID=166442 RepID=A0AAW0ZDA2_9HYME
MQLLARNISPLASEYFVVSVSFSFRETFCQRSLRTVDSSAFEQFRYFPRIPRLFSFIVLEAARRRDVACSAWTRDGRAMNLSRRERRSSAVNGIRRRRPIRAGVNVADAV